MRNDENNYENNYWEIKPKMKLSPGIAEWRLCDYGKRTRSIVLMRRELLHPLTKKRDEKEKTRFWPVFERWYTEKLKGKMTNKDFQIVQQTFSTKSLGSIYTYKKVIMIWKALQCYCAFYLILSVLQ